MPNEELLLAAIFGRESPCYPYIVVDGERLFLKEAIRKVLESLPIRPKRPGQKIPEDNLRRVIELRFGLEDGKPRTLKEVAKELGGVTEERIRQIELIALRLLRHPSRSKLLKKFIIPTPEELFTLESERQRLENQIAELKEIIAQMNGQPDQAFLGKDKEDLEELMRRFPNNAVWNTVRRSEWRGVKSLRHPDRERRIEGLSDLIELVKNGKITGLDNIGKKKFAFLQKVVQTFQEEQKALS